MSEQFMCWTCKKPATHSCGPRPDNVPTEWSHRCPTHVEPLRLPDGTEIRMVSGYQWDGTRWVSAEEMLPKLQAMGFFESLLCGLWR